MSRRLTNDTFSRRHGEADRARPTGRRGIENVKLVALMLVSLTLFTLSRLDHSLVRAARQAMSETLTPVLSASSIALSPIQSGLRRLAGLFELQGEMDRLKEENLKLRSWEARAKELERRIALLDELAKVVPEISMKFATARVIADANGPFARAALLDAGREAGFKAGYPVINAEGLVGRLVIAGRTSSRLLLATDLNSRVPVYVGTSSTRGIMIGDNGPDPRLAHLPIDHRVKAGEDVFTSGVGGVFPRGLRIGKVVDAGDQLRVELNARLDRLEYVSVLFFDPPGAELAEEERGVGGRTNPTSKRTAGRNGELGGGR
jgi:rod shape-determining protein MreC